MLRSERRREAQRLLELMRAIRIAANGDKDAWRTAVKQLSERATEPPPK